MIFSLNDLMGYSDTPGYKACYKRIEQIAVKHIFRKHDTSLLDLTGHDHLSPDGSREARRFAHRGVTIFRIIIVDHLENMRNRFPILLPRHLDPQQGRILLIA